MSVRVKAAVLVLAVAVPAFLLAPVLFPPPPGPEPSSAQLPFFIALSAFDSLLLGVGVAFVVFGWPLVRRVAPDSRARAVAMFVAVAWLTLSWYPHIGLHSSGFGASFAGLLAIDYGFHVPTYIIGLMLIWGLSSYLQGLPDRAAPDPEPSHAPDRRG